MYTERNFRTKKALREAVEKGEDVYVYQPGLGEPPKPGQKGIAVEGPHYPEPHRWYAQVDLDENRRVVKVK